jgi:hypothetical protein
MAALAEHGGEGVLMKGVEQKPPEIKTTVLIGLAQGPNAGPRRSR